VAELVRVHDRADGLHEAVGDVERDDGDEPPVWGQEAGPRLLVDLDTLCRQAGALPLLDPSCEHPPDVLAPEDRTWDRRRLAAPVAVEDDVWGKQFGDCLGVAHCDGGEEAARELVALLA
jgi:hypothetical protein